MHNLMRESRKSHGSQTRLQYILQGALTRDNKEGIGKYCTCFHCSAIFFVLSGAEIKKGSCRRPSKGRNEVEREGGRKGEGAALAVPKPAASSLPFLPLH